MLSKLAGLSLLYAAPMAAAMVAFSSSAAAQDVEQTLLEAQAGEVVFVIRGEKTPEEVLAPVLLAAVPSEQFKQISAQLISEYGPLSGVESVAPADANSGMVVLRFEKALVTAAFSIERAAPHLVNGLLIQDVETLGDSFAKIETELSTLPGDVGVLFTRLDSGAAPQIALNADEQLAIGSTFKLYILSALARSIENGERKWSDVVEINRQSFPSGQLQDWPKGAPVTLQTLATMMISISDNTATDVLLYEVGRDAVEAELIASGHSEPDKTLPFLSTLQMFGLKGSPGNLSKYVAADENTQRMILADFEDDVAGDPSRITPPRFTEPLAIDTVEWFASGNDLAGLAGRLAALSDPTAREIMAVNPGLSRIQAADWAYAGHKGGSEPGVLNGTWLLRDTDGNWSILTMSWNNTNATVARATFDSLAQRILALAD